jgi:plastocyanin
MSLRGSSRALPSSHANASAETVRWFLSDRAHARRCRHLDDTIVVHDRSTLHNFHLASNTDPSVDFRTGLDFVGDQTFTVTFKPGLRYAYACEPHYEVMNGQFRVDELPTTSTTASPPPPKGATLTARVNAAGVYHFGSDPHRLSGTLRAR